MRWTDHALNRARKRGIHPSDVARVLAWGREIRGTGGAVIYAIGDREIRQAAPIHDLSRLRGLHVVCAASGAILTVYRNRELASARGEPVRSRRPLPPWRAWKRRGA